jgi:membrane protein DedA with SNARE-associated domain
VVDLISLIARHGYLVVFLVVLAEAIDMPVPAAVALVGGGAAAAAHSLRLPVVLVVAVAAMLIGDSLMFILGRYMGWGLLGLLCKISISPETCILRSAESFYKRGKTTLVIAKFIPGVNTMAPPLAGSMRMHYAQFVWLDGTGAVLYTFAYVILGFYFRDFVVTITRGFHTAGHVVGLALLIALAGYFGYRFWLYRRNRVFEVVPRVQVQELARRLASDDRANVQLVDVRSHGYYDSGAMRIKGSIRIEPNNLSSEIKNFPKDKDIYVYCT